jgi:chromosome segregation ATPase
VTILNIGENMNHEKIDGKIKELNARRAKEQRLLNDIEKNYRAHKLSDSSYEKHKQKYETKIEKIKKQIRELEKKMCQ